MLITQNAIYGLTHFLRSGLQMLIALPGIIGSVVSFVLKAASAAVGFIAEHVWVLAIALVGFLYRNLSQSPHYNRSKSYTKKRKK